LHHTKWVGPQIRISQSFVLCANLSDLPQDSVRVAISDAAMGNGPNRSVRVTQAAFSAATAKMLDKAEAAFWAQGYAAPTMAMLGEACGLGRRALYYHFRSKEDVFRGVMRHFNAKYLEAAEKVAEQGLERGDGAAEVVGAYLDARYGPTRRRLATSPHGREINDTGFRVGPDIMIEVAYEANLQVTNIIEALCASGRLRLRPGISSDIAAAMITDGARGVNQARPPIPEDEIAARYYAIANAILFGCAISSSETGLSQSQGAAAPGRPE